MTAEINIEEEAKSIVLDVCAGLRLSTITQINAENGELEIIVEASKGNATLTYRPQMLAEQILRDSLNFYTEFYKDEMGEEWSDINLIRDACRATMLKLRVILDSIADSSNIEEHLEELIKTTSEGYAKQIEDEIKPVELREEYLKFYEGVERYRPCWENLAKYLTGDNSCSLVEMQSEQEYAELIEKADVGADEIVEIITDCIKKRGSKKREYTPRGLAYEHTRRALRLPAKSYETWKIWYRLGKEHYNDLIELGLIPPPPQV
jgi:hypothetical protein